MLLAAPAASHAKSFQLQPLPFGRLSYHSFPAPGLNENRMPIVWFCQPETRKMLALPIFTACSGQRGRSDKVFRFIPSGSLIFRHMSTSTTQCTASRTIRIVDDFMAAAIKEYG